MSELVIEISSIFQGSLPSKLYLIRVSKDGWRAIMSYNVVITNLSEKLEIAYGRKFNISLDLFRKIFFDANSPSSGYWPNTQERLDLLKCIPASGQENPPNYSAYDAAMEGNFPMGMEIERMGIGILRVLQDPKMPYVMQMLTTGKIPGELLIKTDPDTLYAHDCFLLGIHLEEA